MPDDLQGSPVEQSPSPATTADSSGMPAEVAAYVAEMASGLGDLGAVLDGQSDAETPGNDANDETDAGRPADEARGPEAGSDDDDDPTTDTDGTGTDEDLSQYPERVQAAWKKLSRSERAAVRADAERSAAEKTQADRIRADELQKQADEQAAKIAEVRGRNAKYIGLEPVKREDGSELPSYDEITRLLKARGGDDVLEDKYGLSRDEAQEQLATWDERRTLLDGNQDWFDTQAWRKLSYHTIQGLKRVEGIDPNAVMAGIQSPDQVIDRVVSHLNAKHEADLAAQKKGYEARIDSLTKNGSAVAGRALAATLRTPDGGGRGGSGAQMTRAQAAAAMQDPARFERDKDAIYTALGL